MLEFGELFGKESRESEEVVFDLVISGLFSGLGGGLLGPREEEEEDLSGLGMRGELSLSGGPVGASKRRDGLGQVMEKKLSKEKKILEKKELGNFEQTKITLQEIQHPWIQKKKEYLNLDHRGSTLFCHKDKKTNHLL